MESAGVPRIAFMTFACPTYRFSEVLDLAVRQGYDGIEFRCDADHQHGVVVESTKADRAGYRRALEDAGVAACCLATSLRYVTPEAVADTPARLELAADIGAPGMRVFCGPLPEGMTIEQAIPVVAENLSRVADLARQAGVRLWLETHDSISRGVHAGAIVAAVNHPYVAINYDNMHPYRNGEPLDATWQAVGSYVQHSHFHDAVAEPGRPIITPFGEGGMPLAEMYALLRGSGFQGYLSGEWFAEQLGPTPDASLANYKAGLRRLEEEWQRQQG